MNTAGEIKEKFKMVLMEFHEAELPELVERKGLFDLSMLESRVNKVFAVIGPRRAGKTYLLYQIIRALLAKGLTPSDLIYVNFEDERLAPLKGEELQSLLDAYFELYQGKSKPHIFLDEIQNVSGWDRFVRRLHDKGFKIFITGSNSRMLSREIATSLRGRTLTLEVFPFSFKEFIELKGVKVDEDFRYTKARHQIAKLYEEYFFSGGYPEVILAEDKAFRVRILQDYFNTVFYRDLVERYGIQNTELLRLWLNTLVANTSSLINFSKIENDFKSRGMKLSKATLSYFAGYVEDAYFGFFVELFSESVRKRQVNPRKFYLVDVGIHNFLTIRAGENRGRILENLVYLALRRKTLPLFYYKTGAGHEIDFIVREGKDTRLLQVCYDLSHIDTFSREKEALISGMRELGLKSGAIINQYEKRTEEIEDIRIEILPAWEWLIAEEM